MIRGMGIIAAVLVLASLPWAAVHAGDTVVELEALLQTAAGRAAAEYVGIRPEWLPSELSGEPALERASALLREWHPMNMTDEPPAELLQALREIQFAPPAVANFATASERFTTTLEHVEGQWLEVRKVAEGTTLGEAFPSNDRVLVAIGSKGDYSLIVGDRVLAGSPLSAPKTIGIDVRQSVRSGGLCVEFDSVPPEALALLKAKIAQEEHTVALSCVNAACLALKASGITLAGNEGALPVFRTPALRRMIKDGFFGTDGERLNIRFYVNGETRLQAFLDEMGASDKLNSRGMKLKGLRNPDGFRDIVDEAQKDMDPEVRQKLLVFLKDGITISSVALVTYQASNHDNQAR